MTEPFGEMLRRYRLAAGLTQEELAERALLSATSIAALERGRNRAPRLSTLRQLARVLDLSGTDLAAFSRAASPDWSSVPGTAAGAGLGPTAQQAAQQAAHSAVLRDPGTGELRRTSDAPGTFDPAGPSRALGGPRPSSGGVAVIPLPAAAGRRWRSDFVGRSEQVAQLRTAWSRRDRVVEVVGEAGIGKTRLVAELARSLGPEATVVWGRCSQDRLGAYLPFVEIIRQLIAGADPVTLQAAVASGGELTRLVPELTEQVGPLPAPTRAEAGTEQHLLFEAVAGLMATWSPMLLVVDDLHWADEATLALLRYLAVDHRLTGLVIVVTARPSDLDPATSGLIAELGREVDVARVVLGGLVGDELASLVADLVGSPVAPSLVESVATATEGNPFFAEEITLHLVDAGMVARGEGGAALKGDPERAGVPRRVRDTVLRRLTSLSGDGMTLLSGGAVIGREWDLATAAAASDLRGPLLVDAADEALLSGMVVETGPGHFSFSHALVRDAVNGRLSFARRASIHRRVAEHMEGRWPAEPATAAELARHWAAVAEVDPTAIVAAATWAVRAGDVALATAAAEDAIARYEQASALWATASAGHVDALIRLGEALRYRGRADDADARFWEATRLSVALGDVCLQARAAIGLGQRYPYWDIDAPRIEVLEASLAALPPGEQTLRVLLMGLLVTHLVNGFLPHQAARRDGLADELSAIAADPSTHPDLMLAIGQTRIYDCLEDPSTLSTVAGRLLELAGVHRDLRVEAGARFAHALAALDDGDMARLRSASERYDDVVVRLDDPRERSQATMVRATIAYVEGRYDDAETLSDRALALGQASGDFNAELLHYAQGLLRAVDQGLAGDVLPLLLASGEYRQIASFDAGTALCAALAGELDLARDNVERLVASGYQGSPRGADRLAPTAFLAHACYLSGAAAEAGVLYEWLSATPATAVRVGPLAGWWGPVDHHRGCLARLLGRPDEAERRLRHALTIEARMGAGAFAARTGAELARVLSTSNPAEAAAVASRAASCAASLGAAGVSKEVEAVLAGLLP